MNAQTARDTALAVLLASKEGQHAQAFLNKTLGAGSLSERDKALCTELVYGVLRHELRLSHILNTFLTAPKKTPPILRLILIMALYEWLYLEKIPNHAVVNNAVNMTRKRFDKRLANVANGVLRTMLRESANMTETWYHTEHIANPVQKCALAFSIPQWIVELWSTQYNIEKATVFAKASSHTPWPCFRVNSQAKEAIQLLNHLLDNTTNEAFHGIQIAPWAVRIPPRKNLHELQTLCLSGRLSRQGAGSQRILDVLNIPSWRGSIWDACAGFGNKTFALLEQGAELCAASDTHQGRLAGLQREAQRLELPCPPVFVHSILNGCPANIQPQNILLDVPCSGLGTLARHPDIKYKRTPQDLQTLCETQQQLLHSAWACLPENGRLAYITCTVNKDENEHQIIRFLKNTSNCYIEKETLLEPDNFGSDIMYGAVLHKRS